MESVRDRGSLCVRGLGTVWGGCGVVWGVEPTVVGAADGTPALPFEAFYRALWREAAGWAAGLTGDVGVGEEIAQEVFVRVAGRYEGLVNPTAYVRVAVVHAARSWHRSQVRRVGREQRAAVVDGDRGVGSDELLGSLACLPYEQRAALVLRYWVDWDEATIAEALGCRAVTVRTRAKRALDRLRRLLEEEGER
jgi:RNA polymerase sigma factor (sigma-70 family)